MKFVNNEENTSLISRLDNIIKSNRVSHAYIFEGSHCIDKRAFAESFAKGILCSDHIGENCGKCSICSKIDHGNHEDMIYVGDEGESIKDAQIIKLQERLKSKPFGERHIVIITGSDTMTLRAQNRLLKTLEEPPGKTVIILLSENMDNLVPTIQSRCVKYKLNYFGSDGYDFMLGKAEQIADMALRKEPFYLLKEEAEKILKEPENIGAFFDSLEIVYRNMLLKDKNAIAIYSDEEIVCAVHAVETARKQLKQGVSASYSIKNLLLKIGG